MRYTCVIIPILFFTVLLVSCGSQESIRPVPDTSQNRAKVTLKRLDQQFFSMESPDQLPEFLAENPVYMEKFMGGAQIGQKGVVETLSPMVGHSSMDTIKAEIQERFGDFSVQMKEFEDAFSLLKHYYPENGDVVVNTCISGLRKDLYLTKDFDQVFVGVDYFLGDGATYRPNNYLYINKRYKPSMVVPLTMQYVSAKYNDIDVKDNTLLAQMIYFGKAFYFTKSMLPYTADSLIIGYDTKEWYRAENHQKEIWGVFIEKELLFSTSHMDVMRFINEAPSTPTIADVCPGRIGQFMGWKIVNEYMRRNPDVTLQELMDETDAQKIFNKSKFKPAL